MTLSYIPITKPFLKTLAQGLLDRTRTDPSALMDITVLLPTRRACRSLRDVFLDLRDGKPILLPRIQAIADVDADEITLLLSDVDEITSIPPAISPLERLGIFTQMVGKFRSNLHFDGRLQLAQALAQFLDTLEREGLSLDGLDHLVRDEFANHWQLTLDFLNILRTVYPAYLANAGKIDPVRRQNMLLSALSTYWTEHPPKTPVIAAGITGSIKSTRPLLKCIHHLPAGEVIIPSYIRDFDPSILQEGHVQHPYTELSSMITDIGGTWEDIDIWSGVSDAERYEQNLKNRTDFILHSMTPAEKTGEWMTPSISIDFAKGFENFEVCEADDILEEGKIIAALVRQTLESPHKTVAVVSPSQSISKSIISACAEYGIELNDSAGSPLLESQNTRFIFTVLDLVLNDFHPVSILEFLRHPYTEKTLSDDHVSFLDKEIFRGLRKDPNDIIPFIKSVLDKGAAKPHKKYPADEDIIPYLNDFFVRLSEIQAFCGKNAALREIIHAHLQICEFFSQKEDTISILWRDEEGEALKKIFENLLDPDLNLPDLSLSEYKIFLSHYIQNIRVNKIGSGHPRTALLGIYESRLTHADHVIIAGFNEGIWPGSTGADPWMSRGMRKSYGIPDEDSMIGRMALDLLQLCAVPRVTITRSLMENNRPTIESRWLSRINVLMMGNNIPPQHIYNTFLPKWTKTKSTFQGTIAPHLPRKIYLQKDEKPTSFSATQIELMTDNPYYFYIRHILMLRPLDLYDLLPDARIKGTITHAVLDSFVSSCIHQTRFLTQNDLLNLLYKTFDDLYISQSNRSLLQTRIALSLSSFLLIDEKRKSNGYTPLWTEKDYAASINIDGQEMNVRARFDRIDLCPDQSLSVIDYKTTKSVPSFQKVISGEKPQIGIQVFILAHTVFDDSRINLKNSVSSAALWPIVPDQTDVSFFEGEKIDEMIDHIKTGLLKLFSRYIDDSFSFHYLIKEGESIKETEFSHFIRKQEWFGFSQDGNCHE